MRRSIEGTPRIDDRIELPDGRWLAYAEFGDPAGRQAKTSKAAGCGSTRRMTGAHPQIDDGRRPPA
jgi:hypothetical protein